MHIDAVVSIDLCDLRREAEFRVPGPVATVAGAGAYPERERSDVAGVPWLVKPAPTWDMVFDDLTIGGA